VTETHPQISVLSLNTAIDRVVRLERLVPGGVMRAEDATAFAGGKGLNVARALRRLSEQVQVIGFLGGSVRPFIENACTKASIQTVWAPTAGDSRTCTILIDEASGSQTVVNEPGPRVQQSEIDVLLQTVRASVRAGDLLCISGSAPPGVADELYGQIVREMNERGVRVLVDASGGALCEAVSAQPWAVCPNEDELRAATGETGDTTHAAGALGAAIPVVIVTLGRRGCLLVHEGQTWRVHAPTIREVNAVGSGDAFAAGFLAGIARGQSPIDAVTLAVACGASNASRLEPSIGPESEIERLRLGVRVERLPT
jgi:tagatose 6-phosphate kinase